MRRLRGPSLGYRDLRASGSRTPTGHGISRNESEAYDSLWIPGLVAVLVCGITTLVVLAGIA